MWETLSAKAINNRTTKRLDHPPRKKPVWNCCQLMTSSETLHRLRHVGVKSSWTVFCDCVRDLCGFFPRGFAGKEITGVSFPLTVETHFLGQWTPRKRWLSLKWGSFKHTFAPLVPETMSPTAAKQSGNALSTLLGNVVTSEQLSASVNNTSQASRSKGWKKERHSVNPTRGFVLKWRIFESFKHLC